MVACTKCGEPGHITTKCPNNLYDRGFFPNLCFSAFMILMVMGLCFVVGFFFFGFIYFELNISGAGFDANDESFGQFALFSGFILLAIFRSLLRLMKVLLFKRDKISVYLSWVWGYMQPVFKVSLLFAVLGWIDRSIKPLSIWIYIGCLWALLVILQMWLHRRARSPDLFSIILGPINQD